MKEKERRKINHPVHFSRGCSESLHERPLAAHLALFVCSLYTVCIQFVYNLYTISFDSPCSQGRDSTLFFHRLVMSGIIGVVSRFTVIGGAILVAVWAYKEYLKRQQEQVQYEEPNRREVGNRTSVKRSGPPPQPHNICSICQDDLSVPLEILPCNHIFHRVCIRQWFQNRMICPYCNTPISGDDVQEYQRRLKLWLIQLGFRFPQRWKANEWSWINCDIIRTNFLPFVDHGPFSDFQIQFWPGRCGKGARLPLLSL